MCGRTRIWRQSGVSSELLDVCLHCRHQWSVLWISFPALHHKSPKSICETLGDCRMARSWREFALRNAERGRYILRNIAIWLRPSHQLETEHPETPDICACRGGCSQQTDQCRINEFRGAPS